MTPRDALELARLLLDTLRLSGDPDPAEMRTRWAQADQAALVMLAKYEGADIWLARRLRTLGITLEPASAGALDAAATRARARTLRADAALRAVLQAFRATQVECVLLKSAALRRLTDRLPYADARATADVDLLVPEADGDHALGVLRARGWGLLNVSALRHSGDAAIPLPGERETLRALLAGAPKHHLPSVADASGVAIELHLTTGPVVRPMEAWRRTLSDRAAVTLEAEHAWVPGDTWLLVHAVTHALVDADEHARSGLRLRYWLDGAVLLGGGQLRWDSIRERLRTGEMGPPALARAWLWVAAQLAGQDVGIDALGTGDMAALQLDRLLAWRLTVLTRYSASDAWAEKLLEEGARIEGGLAPERPWKPEKRARRIRRRAAQLAARAAWRWWRVRL